jgi:hypothetical protein
MLHVAGAARQTWSKERADTPRRASVATSFSLLPGKTEGVKQGVLAGTNKVETEEGGDTSHAALGSCRAAEDR